jgi:DNA repair protein RadD
MLNAERRTLNEKEADMVEDRVYQAEAVQAVYRFMERGYGNPVVVVPTGAGKSFIMAILIRDAVTQWPGTRILCLADVKELIEQNAEAYGTLAQTAQYGIYSASVGARDSCDPVIFAQIQSCHKCPELFGWVDFVIVDECHMINPKQMGMYREFIDGLRERNPLCKVVGFTATPYRLGHGYVFKGAETLFSGIAYDIPVEKLIEQGYLVPPVARAGSVHADTANIEHSDNGEFKEESATREFSRITVEAVDDMLSRLPDRKSVLVFACSLAHAAQIAELLSVRGEKAVDVVTGKTAKMEREAIVERVRSGKTRWTVNMGVFTKGFNAKNIDTVVLLRATESPALYVQMIGRGLRPWPGKADCVVLDYGENVMRHGPINAVRPKEPGKKKEGESMVMAKECPKCLALIALGCLVCPHCGFEMTCEESGPKHGTRPSEAPLLASPAEIGGYEWRDVMGMQVSEHGSRHPGARRSMRVAYRVGVADWVSEWVCPEHTGYARQKAEQWMNARGYNLLRVDDALAVEWPMPKRIKVKTGGKWPEVVDHDLGASLLMG